MRKKSESSLRGNAARRKEKKSIKFSKIIFLSLSFSLLSPGEKKKKKKKLNPPNNMLSDSVLLLRLALLRVVHAAAGAEERLLREATRMRWALRDRIESSSSTSSSSSSSALAPALLKSAIWVLTLCVRLLTWFLSLLALPVKLQRRWLWGAETTKSLKASSASASTSTSTTSTTTSKQQARGRPPPRPATEAAVVLAEAREEEIPLERVADVLGW